MGVFPRLRRPASHKRSGSGMSPPRIGCPKARSGTRWGNSRAPPSSGSAAEVENLDEGACCKGYPQKPLDDEGSAFFATASRRHWGELKARTKNRYAIGSSTKVRPARSSISTIQMSGSKRICLAK